LPRVRQHVDSWASEWEDIAVRISEKLNRKSSKAAAKRCIDLYMVTLPPVNCTLQTWLK
jgi:hypothetical protein